MRIALVTALVASLGTAPIQCSRQPDPALRTEDSAGDALWDLAQDFQKKNDPAAARATLSFLVERYPSNRHAAAAREMLAGKGDGGA